MDLHTFFELGGLAITIVGGWFTLKNQVGNLEQKARDNRDATDQEHQNIWKVIGELRMTLDEHLKGSAQTRLELEKEMGRIRESNGKTDSKLDTILSMITELSKRFEKL